jgi:hypothetical protein
MTKPKKAAPKKTGRPSGYSKEIAEIICSRLASGESLRAICRDEHMPSQSMVFRWLETNLPFREQYARAREAQADTLVDEILEISDDGSNDWMERHNAEGENIGWQLNGEHVQRSRLRVDSRKWFASKVAPKKYGDKLELAGDRENPLTVIHEAGKSFDAKLERFIAGRTREAES